jgi:hypothetical protein
MRQCRAGGGTDTLGEVREERREEWFVDTATEPFLAVFPLIWRA